MDKESNTSHQAKAWMLFGIVLIAIVIMLAGSLWKTIQNRENLLAAHKTKTRHLVEAAHSVLAHFHTQEKSGVLDAQAAKAAAMRVVKAMRYDGSREYFWIQDRGKPTPMMIMHPTVPALDGKTMEDHKFNKATTIQPGSDGPVENAEARNLFVAFNEVIDKAGHGFVTYDWPKPLAGGGVTSETYPKLAYVRNFEGWNWVVGSSTYVDDLDRRFAASLKGELAGLAGVSLILLVVSGLGRSIGGAGTQTESRRSEIDDLRQEIAALRNDLQTQASARDGERGIA